MNDANSNRISKDYYFMKIAEDVSTRAICVKRKVGAVVVKGNQILATGYNGAPRVSSTVRRTPVCAKR